MPVRSIVKRSRFPFDVLVVATLGNADVVLAALDAEGIPREQLVTLRAPVAEKTAAEV